MSICSQAFKLGLRRILEGQSQFRNHHSLEDVLFCINNCKEALSFTQDDIFSNDIPNSWFFCNILCEICHARCQKSFGHSDCHDNNTNCQSTVDNEVYFCKVYVPLWTWSILTNDINCPQKCITVSSDKSKLPLVLKPMSKEEGFIKNIITYPFRRGIVECDQHGIIYDKNWVVSYYEDTILSKHLHKWQGESLMSQVWDSIYNMSTSP